MYDIYCDLFIVTVSELWQLKEKISADKWMWLNFNHWRKEIGEKPIFNLKSVYRKFVGVSWRALADIVRFFAAIISLIFFRLSSASLEIIL